MGRTDGITLDSRGDGRGFERGGVGRRSNELEGPERFSRVFGESQCSIFFHFVNVVNEQPKTLFRSF